MAASHSSYNHTIILLTYSQVSLLRIENWFPSNAHVVRSSSTDWLLACPLCHVIVTWRQMRWVEATCCMLLASLFPHILAHTQSSLTLLSWSTSSSSSCVDYFIIRCVAMLVAQWVDELLCRLLCGLMCCYVGCWRSNCVAMLLLSDFIAIWVVVLL